MEFEIEDITPPYKGPDKFYLPILQKFIDSMDSDIIVEGVNLKGKITINTSVEDLMMIFDLPSILQKEKANRLKYGTHYSFKLEVWIKEIQKRVMGLNIEEKLGKKIFNYDHHHHMRCLGFNETVDGKLSTTVSEFASRMMVMNHNSKAFTINPYFFYDIAEGAGYGTIYFDLLKELDNIKRTELEDLDNSAQTLELPDISGKNHLKIGLLYKLGLTDAIVKMTGQNLTTAGKLIAQFTEIKPETAKKLLQSIYRSSAINAEDHPFNKMENEDTINEILKKLKINNLD